MSRFKSVRYKKARTTYFVRKYFLILLWAVFAVMLAIGGYLAYLENPSGWLMLSFSVLPLMPLFWYYSEAKSLPIEPHLGLEGVVSGSVLGSISDNSSVHDLATSVVKHPRFVFLQNRVGVTKSMLLEISNGVNSLDDVFYKAYDIKNKLKMEKIEASLIGVAIILSHSESNTLLASLNIRSEQLIESLTWQEVSDELWKDLNRRHPNGGLARDWSFGYIPVLESHAVNVSKQVSTGVIRTFLEDHRRIIYQMMDSLAGDGRQNVLLVGKNGVGKTSIIHGMAYKLLDSSLESHPKLRLNQVFMLDASNLMASTREQGDIERVLSTIFNEAYHAKNVILCFDNAEMFFEDGKGALDASRILQPIIENGSIRLILAMDEHKYLELHQRNPSLLDSMNKLIVNPTDEAETYKVLETRAHLYENQNKVCYTYQSLMEIFNLSSRYVHDSAMPGRALRLMEMSAQYAKDKSVTPYSVQMAIEKSMNIKVATSNTVADKQKLLNIEFELSKKVIGQERAVSAVSNALRRARSGVRNQERPIGTFMFLGPTGVGKTELAKALGDVYFGGRDNLIRIDLNEYVRSDDVIRLIADPAEDSHSLTAQVMNNPFSVVLFDEIEKAAPEVLTTLLQVLDEGVLRDSKNREISFRDTIIIMTSNAGANDIREYANQGLSVEAYQQSFIDKLIESNQFKPEFLNRFDELLVFRPLIMEELAKIVVIYIKNINKTLESQQVQVELDEGAIFTLVRAGYDPRLGARPLRRVVQRAVENYVARKMLDNSTESGALLHITQNEVESELKNNT